METMPIENEYLPCDHQDVDRVTSINPEEREYVVGDEIDEDTECVFFTPKLWKRFIDSFYEEHDFDRMFYMKKMTRTKENIIAWNFIIAGIGIVLLTVFAYLNFIEY